MSAAYQKAKSVGREKQAKLCDYRDRLKRANESIEGMKEVLGENGVDMFLASEDFYRTQERCFDRAVSDIRTLLQRSYPDFDFAAFDADVKKATDARKWKEGPPVANKANDYKEEPISEDEPDAISSDDERFAADKAPGKKRPRRE